MTISRRTISAIIVASLGILGGILVWESYRERSGSTDPHASDGSQTADRLYERLPTMIDPERRIEPLDNILGKDREGYPKNIIGGRYESPYPDDANPVYDRDVVVPIVMLPRPDAVKAWSASTEGHVRGWHTKNEAIGKVKEKRGQVSLQVCLIGHPRGRDENSTARRTEVLLVDLSSPKGSPLLTLMRVRAVLLPSRLC